MIVYLFVSPAQDYSIWRHNVWKKYNWFYCATLLEKTCFNKYWSTKYDAKIVDLLLWYIHRQMFSENDNTFNTWSNHPKTGNNIKFAIDLMIVSMDLAFTKVIFFVIFPDTVVFWKSLYLIKLYLMHNVQCFILPNAYCIDSRI